jgi:dTMP kinase
MRPPLICLTGVDGCGKSTQARLLTERLRDAGWDAVTVWTGGRPYVSRPLVRLVKRRLRAPMQQPDGSFEARGAGLEASEEFGEYLTKSNAMFRKHWLLRRGWTDVSLFEHMAEANLAVQPHLRAGRAVVCDRYLYKSIVNLAILLDLEVTRLPTLLKHPALWMVPKPDLYFLLDLPAEVAAARKTDLPSIEYVARRVPVYRSLAAYSDMPVVDATQSPADVSDAIWARVSSCIAQLERQQSEPAWIRRDAQARDVARGKPLA